MPGRDLYRTLGVPADADPGEIRRAYQKLARRCHPELKPGDTVAERRFAAVAEAYRVLSDPGLRRRYDAEGEADEDGGWAATVAESREFATAGGRTVERVSRRVEVRRWRGGRPAGEGAAVDAEVTLGFAEAIRGTTVSFSVQQDVRCPDCGGAGRRESGACERCGGRGAVVELERVRLRVPAGVADGGRLEVRGRGPGAGRDGRPGDLAIAVRVRPHPYFRRRGDDVHGDVPITLAEAILGAEIEVPTLDGPVRVTIPPGTSGGQRLRLRGRGVKPPRGERGDHYITVRIAVPAVVTEEVRELLGRLGQGDPRRGLGAEKV